MNDVKKMVSEGLAWLHAFDLIVNGKESMLRTRQKETEKLQADLEKAEKVIEQIADLDACYRVNRKILNYFKEKEKNE